MADWIFTHHANARIEQMHLTVAEVAAALDAPELSYPCGRDYPGRSLTVSGRLAVVIDDSAPVVVTVLWRGERGRAA